MHLSFTKAVAPTILLAFFIYTTTLVDLSLQDGSDECEAKFDDAEKCFQSLMILGKNTQINKETFQALCQTEFDAISCIQDYKTKCVKGMASMVFNLLAKKFNSTFRNLCSNEPAMDEFLGHFNCLKESLMSDGAKLCTEQYHLRLEMIDTVPKSERFPIICCGFYELKSCSGNALRVGCKDEKSIEYMEKMVLNFVSGFLPCVCADLPSQFYQVGDMNKMFCHDWQSLEVCREKLPADLGAAFTKIGAMDLATAESSKKIKSFLRLLKHLIEAAGH